MLIACAECGYRDDSGAPHCLECGARLPDPHTSTGSAPASSSAARSVSVDPAGSAGLGPTAQVPATSDPTTPGSTADAATSAGLHPDADDRTRVDDDPTASTADATANDHAPATSHGGEPVGVTAAGHAKAAAESTDPVPATGSVNRTAGPAVPTAGLNDPASEDQPPRPVLRRALLPAAVALALVLAGSLIWLTNDPDPKPPVAAAPTPAGTPAGPPPSPLDPGAIGPTPTSAPTTTAAGAADGGTTSGGQPAASQPTAGRTPARSTPRTPSQTTGTSGSGQRAAQTNTTTTPARKPSFLPPNPPGQDIEATATASCRSGGWQLNISARLIGFTDTRVIVHTEDRNGWVGSDVDGGPTQFRGVAPEIGYGPLPSSQASVTWFVWGLNRNGDEVSSDAWTTRRPSCAG